MKNELNEDGGDGGQFKNDDRSFQKDFNDRVDLAMTPSSVNLGEIVKQYQIFDETKPCTGSFCKHKRRYHFHCNTCNQVN